MNKSHPHWNMFHSTLIAVILIVAIVALVIFSIETEPPSQEAFILSQSLQEKELDVVMGFEETDSDMSGAALGLTGMCELYQQKANRFGVLEQRFLELYQQDPTKENQVLYAKYATLAEKNAGLAVVYCTD